ncbi:sigma-70 family RNA polymerase sigma factor [Methylopila sp. 73B]|uniref:sigma-70 family RNA polymerase sigma factor n=1 Tax=Methylopila sp. 73B TaxID=1120792 RepID=UPI00035DB9E8|nr:sigma-70 family RNA polymerase sigma factor [Methylopila sp. 73B]
MTWDVQALFRRHAQEIARSLRRRGLTEDCAADITQDTFVRVLATPPAETAETHNPRAYLHRVAHNLGVNHRRRERLLETTSLDADDAPDLVDSAPSPEASLHARQRLALTFGALAELPERTRRAFEMHRLGERTIAEIADELGLSTTRTWTLIRDAYRHLVDRVGEA